MALDGPFERIGRSGSFTFPDDLYTGERTYEVFEAATELAAAQSALTQLQTDLGGNTLNASLLSDIQIREREATDSYLVTFQFKPLATQKQTDGPRTEFEFSEDSERKFVALSTTAYGAALDFGNAIGVQKTAAGRYEARGADIPRSAFNFSKRIIVATTDVDNAFVQSLSAFHNTVNNGAFAGFSAGEVLFRGASGSQRSDEDFEINIRFGARPNLSSVDIGGVIISANGWDIIDPFLLDDEDGTFGIWATYVNAVFVHRWYNLTDFSGLPL